MKQLLSVKNLHVSYGKKEVLRDLSLNVECGEIVALVGLNGSGKSTLLKSIVGLQPSLSGEIHFSGQDITSWNAHRRIAEGISFVMQGFRVFTSLTFTENLEISGNDLSKESRDQRLNEVAEIMPFLKKLYTKRAGLLSGGEQKILAILMHFIKRPGLFLLDEPLAGLSSATSQEIIKLLVKLNAAYNTTIVVVEHNIEPLLQIINKVFVLSNGHAIESDLPSQNESFEERVEQILTGPDELLPASII